MTSFAQEEEPTVKYSVATNSFWSNWFVQAGAQWAAFYVSAEHGLNNCVSPFKSFRSNPQAAIALGKWFTPGIGVRTKVQGIWGKANDTSFKYWTINEQVLFNISNMLCGYNPNRVYNFSVFGGGGFARNCTHNLWGMDLTVGILNQFYVCKKFAINVELGWERIENDFFSTEYTVNNGVRGWDSHDNILYAEIGFTYNFGKATWDAVPDVDAIKALSQAQIDALNAQLADAEAENARLKALLAEKKEVAPKIVKELAATPISVFFELDKYEIASEKDLVNLQGVANYVKDNEGTLLVTGYADSATGTPNHNQWLSERRAETVANELVNMGVSPDKISTDAKGGVDDLSPISFNRRATVQIKD